MSPQNIFGVLSVDFYPYTDEMVAFKHKRGE